MSRKTSIDFQEIISKCLRPKLSEHDFTLLNPIEHFDAAAATPLDKARSLNAAFLIVLAGEAHQAYSPAQKYLHQMRDDPEWQNIADFYLKGLEHIREELSANSNLTDRLTKLVAWFANENNLKNIDETQEKLWSVFFPEAVGVRKNWKAEIKTLRETRKVSITVLNPQPLKHPAKQILFTSNVLLTTPPPTKSVAEIALSLKLKSKVKETVQEPQRYWFDHPIQIGVEYEKNEILYGLRGLNDSLNTERQRGNLAEDEKVACVLSVSVTHDGLKSIARPYLKEELHRCERLNNLHIYAFTEADTLQLIEEVLAPAAQHYLNHENAQILLNVFGVDGHYARHYNFLKAIAAIWPLFINPEIRATFKIDLDQIFPQKELIEQTGNSVLEHFKSTLWGAQGIDVNGQPVELGMIAGALVNQGDIQQSLFTPDVQFPRRALSADEHIFFSTLPQALSTEAEMMTRYLRQDLNGKETCILRIHVTGGTNGILVDSLRKHRPFTPSFFGRAEDQAYILSCLLKSVPRLVYFHKDGLIMRHDKHAFAQEAIQAARIGKLLGDYIRILYFTTYARILSQNIASIKEKVDPFTGCFISYLPKTIVHLRFALQAASFFSEGEPDNGQDFICLGVERISEALAFCSGEESPLKQQFQKEQTGWELFYDTIDVLEIALTEDDELAIQLKARALEIIEGCAIQFDE